MYELFLRHYSRIGVLKNAVVEPLQARYTLAVNQDQPLVFTLSADSSEAAQIEEFDIIQVWIRNRSIGIVSVEGGFVPVFTGVVRSWDLITNEDGVAVWEFIAPEGNHILRWRHVLYPAGITNRSEFTNISSERIMKTLVTYNLTSLASVPSGRLRSGSLTTGMGINITVATDANQGNLQSAGLMGGNVLDILQRLAETGGGDFALVWQGGSAWTFQFYLGQLGTDKSSGAERVLFSTAVGNMIRPVLRRRGARASAAIAGGTGEGAERDFVAVLGPDYVAGLHDIEMFIDARNEKTPEGVAERGYIRLEEARATKELWFSTLQTSNQFYSPIPVTGRKTYKPGDLVLVDYGGERVQKISEVKVGWVPSSGDSPLTVEVTATDA